MVTKPIFIQTLQNSHLSSILFVKIVPTSINLKHEYCIHTQGIVPDTLLYIWNNLFLQSMRTSLPIEKLAWRLPKRLQRKENEHTIRQYKCVWPETKHKRKKLNKGQNSLFSFLFLRRDDQISDAHFIFLTNWYPIGLFYIFG